jgi:aconitate decarboxylase
VVDMRKKINVTEDGAVSKAEAYISVKFDDGTTLEKHIEHAKGSIENPLTDAELQKKFMEQATLAIGRERAEKANKAFTSIQEMGDVALISQMY